MSPPWAGVELPDHTTHTDGVKPRSHTGVQRCTTHGQLPTSGLQAPLKARTHDTCVASAASQVVRIVWAGWTAV